MDERRLVFLLSIICSVVVMAVVFGRFAMARPGMGLIAAAGILVVGVILFRGLNVEGLTPFQGAFYVSYLVILIATWTPFKFFAYLTPLVFLGALIVILSISQNSVIMRRTIGLGFLWTLFSLCYLGIYREFEPQNSVIAFFTYSSFFPLILIPSRWLAGQALFEKIVKVTVILLAFEAAYGIVQGCVGLVRLGSFVHAAGDYVDGTIHPWLGTSGRFDNAMFALNMAFGLLLIAQQIVTGGKKYILPFLLCSVAFVMTAVVHLILAFCIALLVGLVFLRPRLHEVPKGIRVAIGVTVVAVPVFTLVILSANLRTIGHKIEAVDNNRNQKVPLAKRILTTMPERYPAMRAVGLGPGQFSSRANLIAAGYLRKLPAPFQVVLTRPFETHALELWRLHYSDPWRGSIERPASSWLAVIAEFGLLGFGLICFLCARLLLRVRAKAIQTRRRLAGFFLATGIFYAFGVGAPEFYWETCQALFVGLLLLKLMHANLMYQEEKPDDEDTPEAAPVNALPPPRRAMLGIR